MNYKTYNKDKDVYFKYILNRKNIKKKEKVINKNDNPFNILGELNLK